MESSLFFIFNTINMDSHMMDYEIMYILFETILVIQNYYHKEIQANIFLDF